MVITTKLALSVTNEAVGGFFADDALSERAAMAFCAVTTLRPCC